MLGKRKKFKEDPNARFLVLGTGCEKCEKTLTRLRRVVEDLGLEGEVSVIESLSVMMRYGIMVTPSIVVDDKVVYSKDVVPSEEELKVLLREAVKE